MIQIHSLRRKILISLTIIICVLPLALILIANSQLTVRETRWKYLHALSDYPSLPYVSLPELKTILQNDTAPFKILAFTEAPGSKNFSSQFISSQIFPKWQTLNHDSVSLYLIASDCGSLCKAESFFSGFGTDCRTFVIRDNSKQFRSYGHLFPDPYRLSRILRFIVPTENIKMIYGKTIIGNSLILDRHNNVKLARLEYSSSSDARSIIVPLPFELADSLCSLDFDTVDLIHVDQHSPSPLFYYFLDMQ